MKILVLTIHYWPEQTGIGAVLTRRCEHLSSAGHEVTVCTAMPFYPEWRVHPAYRRKLFANEKHNGVTILRSWIWVPQRVSSAKRVLLEASFLATSLLRAVTRRRPDLLLVVSPPLGLGLSAVLLSRWTKVPFVFDVQDLQPDAAADLGMLPGPVLPALYRLEALAYRHAALISTVTEGMRGKIISKGIPARKVVVVPPPADNSLFGVGSAVNGQAFRKKHGLEGKFIVAHSGNMGVKQGLGLVLDAASRLQARRDVRFFLAGDGVMRTHLQSRAAALRLNNVQFLPLQEKAEFLQMLAAIDMALIVQQSSVTDIVFPSKTVTLMSAGRPVTAAVSGDSEIARVVRQSKAGIVTEPEKVEPLVTNIQELLRDPARRSAMSIGTRRGYCRSSNPIWWRRPAAHCANRHESRRL
jgi:colanic acid biosynthesis glycosyl transferase WcaI